MGDGNEQIGDEGEAADGGGACEVAVGGRSTPMKEALLRLCYGLEGGALGDGGDSWWSAAVAVDG